MLIIRLMECIPHTNKIIVLKSISNIVTWPHHFACYIENKKWVFCTFLPVLCKKNLTLASPMKSWRTYLMLLPVNSLHLNGRNVLIVAILISINLLLLQVKTNTKQFLLCYLFTKKFAVNFAFTCQKYQNCLATFSLYTPQLTQHLEEHNMA